MTFKKKLLSSRDKPNSIRPDFDFYLNLKRYTIYRGPIPGNFQKQTYKEIKIIQIK